METLIAVAVAVGVLRGAAAPPPEPARIVAEQPKAREKTSRRPVQAAPMLGY